MRFTVAVLPQCTRVLPQMAKDFDKLWNDSTPNNFSANDYERLDKDKTNINRQGYWTPAHKRVKEPLWYEPHLQRLIHIDPSNTINPDQDVIETGQYMVGLRSGIDTAEGPLVNVYDGRGSVAGTITLKRLTVLQTAFNHTQATAPSVMQELDATCFEHEVAKLPMRYQDGSTTQNVLGNIASKCCH